MLGYRKTFQEWLRGLGYDSHINEALYKYLVDEGITPTQLNEMWSQWLTDNNHTGNTLNEKYMSFVNDVLLALGGGASFTPLSLFASGEAGAWYDPSDLSTLFQDSAGTTPVTSSGDPVGLMLDKSGNDVDATQATSAARPLYGVTPDKIDMDQVDDNMSIDFGAAFTGTVLQGTPNGVIHMDIDVSDGAWSLTEDPLYVPDNGEITGMVARDGTLTSTEVSNVKTYLQENGAGTDFAGVTSMEEWFRGRTDITAIYTGGWDTSSVTSLGVFAYNCTSLTTLDVSNWDTSSVTRFDNFALDCFNLTALDVSNWDTSSVTTFDNFARDCTSLTTLDVSNWDTSSVTRFDNFVRDCTSLTTLDVSNWDTSSVTRFDNFVRDCFNLTALEVSNWDTSSVTRFDNFVRDCTSLTTLDVSNWDTSSVTTFAVFAYNCTSLTNITTEGGTGNPFADSPCTNYFSAFDNTNLDQTTIDNILVRIESAGTSNGIFDQSGGSAPSATGEAAIDALRLRGWTITVTGGY